MVSEASNLESVKKLACVDLAQACDLARDLVAEKPQDENAALLLLELVRRQASEQASAVPAGVAKLSPTVAEATRLLDSGQDEQAEIALRRHLSLNPDDTSAMVRMADIAARCGFLDNAVKILERARSLQPQSVEVLLSLATLTGQVSLLERRDRGEAALEFVSQVLELEPASEAALAVRSSILVQFRRFEEALVSYQDRLKLNPLHWLSWVNLAQLLSSRGRVGDAAAALRTCLAINPAYGFAWWELTNLKEVALFEFDIAEMQRVLVEAEPDVSASSAIHFTLGKALHQLKRHSDAMQHWRTGNEEKRGTISYDTRQVERDVDHSIATFTTEYFDERSGYGDPRADPIFIIGMQRAGSTLVEQILASHPAVEATEELFLILKLAQEIQQSNQAVPWQSFVADMGAPSVGVLGDKFLELARHFRSTDRPFFIDKNPANWRFVGLIATILPNAKFIDVRRDPMDCCFANYTHYYEKGVGFAYSQEALGRYYADYVRLMRHFDQVRPGLVHRLIYEDLVDDLEGSVKRLLKYLRLPFDDACLRFFETDRAVFTPSAQQVRQPINRKGIGRWRDYEPWLGDLKAALGEVAETWRH